MRDVLRANPSLRAEKPEQPEGLSRALPKSCSAEHIQHMGADELLALQAHFQLGNSWGEVRFPAKWVALSQPSGSGTINLYYRLKPASNSTEDLELAVLTAVRMVLLALCSPSTSGKHSAIHLAPSTIIAKLTTTWLNLIKAALAKSGVENAGLFSRLKNYRTGNQRELTEIKRLRNYHVRGLWWDIIDPETQAAGTERSNLSPEPSSLLYLSNQIVENDPYLPLPDAFVHEVGWRAGWLIVELMPVLLSAYEALIPKIKSGNRSRKTAEFLSNYNWECQFGEIPFSLYPDGDQDNIAWPPTDLNGLITYLHLAQIAALFVASLSAGPRAGEIMSFTTNCLVESYDGIQLARGKTYKLVEHFEGVERDWPMPVLAIQALHYQIRLSKLIAKYHNLNEESDEAPLWRTLRGNTPGEQLRGSYNADLRKFVRRLGLAALLDAQPLTNHRFRKTIARLVALAHVHAPKILMDIFGHKAIEMTMHYILSNPAILAEMQTIRKELVLIMATKAIRNADENGGPAAKRVQEAVQKMKYRSTDDYGVDNEDDLAMMLTGQGVFWMQPRPGVICTKLSDQVGPCAKGKSVPNPADCQSNCMHRLEEADNRQQVDDTIADIVKKIQRAWAHDDLILAEMWAGQLTANLKRFDNLLEKWSSHPVVASILSKACGKAEDVVI